MDENYHTPRRGAQSSQSNQNTGYTERSPRRSTTQRSPQGYQRAEGSSARQPVRQSEQQFTQQSAQQATPQFAQQTTRQTNRASVGQNVQQPNRRSTRQNVQQSSRQSTYRNLSQNLGETSRQSASQSTNQEPRQTNRQYARQSSGQYTSRKFNQESRQTNRQSVSQNTNQEPRQTNRQTVNQPTVRYSQQGNPQRRTANSQARQQITSQQRMRTQRIPQQDTQQYSRQASARYSEQRQARQTFNAQDDLHYARHTSDEGNYRNSFSSLPTQNTYVGKNSNDNKQKVIFIILAVLLVVALAFAIKTIFFSGTSESSSGESSMAVNDNTVEEVSFTVTFAGDCTLGTDANFSYSGSFPEMYANQSPSYFLENVADIFKSDDLTVVNMEGTLTTSTTREDKTYAFKGDPEYAQILTEGNVEAASLANNHSHDYGTQSYNDTITALDAAGISSFGYDRIAYKDVKGVKVALIGTYELATHEAIKDELLSNIEAAQKENAQVIMVYFHWGNELDTVPDSTQVMLAHAAIDAGADLVIGSHAHCVQGVEKYNGRYIAYGMGNFCFGGNPNPTDKDCMIFQQTFTVKGNEVATDDNINIISCSVSSASGYNNYQPTPATGSEKERIDAKIEARSEALSS